MTARKKDGFMYETIAQMKRMKKSKHNSKKTQFSNHSYAITKKLSDDFLASFEWKRLRMKAFVKYGNKCQCCGASPETGAVLNVDHIKPRKLFPGLSLDINNLQILCSECNHGKGNWDQTDWR